MIHLWPRIRVSQADSSAFRPQDRNEMELTATFSGNHRVPSATYLTRNVVYIVINAKGCVKNIEHCILWETQGMRSPGIQEYSERDFLLSHEFPFHLNFILRFS